ncbi:hypothetical protein ABPG74_017759 [Tetrahymena malaccensis]
MSSKQLSYIIHTSSSSKEILSINQFFHFYNQNHFPKSLNISNTKKLIDLILLIQYLTLQQVVSKSSSQPASFEQLTTKSSNTNKEQRNLNQTMGFNFFPHFQHKLISIFPTIKQINKYQPELSQTNKKKYQPAQQHLNFTLHF